VSADESGEDALDWLMSELVEDGDEVVAIRVIELDEGGELTCKRLRTALPWWTRRPHSN
jgi:hypothetical protein